MGRKNKKERKVYITIEWFDPTHMRFRINISGGVKFESETELETNTQTEIKNNMNSILITGCNRGLGLGIVKQLLNSNKPTKYIFATCRNPDKAQVTCDLIDISIFNFKTFFSFFY